jgi:hypothetical protein
MYGVLYNTQDYWVSGLYPSSKILNAIKNNISDPGSVSILVWMEGAKQTVSSFKDGNRS